MPVEDPKEVYATVDEVIEILKKESEKGLGGYLVVCNGEYWLARKEEVPAVNENKRFIDIGGYC